MKKLLAAVLTLGLLVTAMPATVGATPSYCGITWGSLTKSDPSYTIDQLTNVRTGKHTCFDRMVLDLNGPATGYDVRYVSNVYADGSGQLIPLNGDAKLQIVAHAPTYDPYTGIPTYPSTVGQSLPDVDLSGYQTFKDAKYAGSFEGQTTIGLGVRARLPFRVFTLENKIVIDVAHYW